MQHAYPPGVPADTHIHAVRRSNLLELLQRPSTGGATGLARALGNLNLRGHLSNIKEGRRDMGNKLASDIEDALRLGRGWMDQQHLSPGEPIPGYGVAHQTSHPTVFDSLPTIQWERILNNEVPDLFCSALPDDALAPEFPKGTAIVWTTRRRVAPGRIALVKDRHGQLHARICHQGRAPGQWIAAPTNPAFISFDSQEEGLSVIAVYKGRLEPDDD